MIAIQGKGISIGVASGPLYFYRRIQAGLCRYSVTDREAEWDRFKAAQARAVEQLGALVEKARQEVGSEAAMLFETHQMMCEDLDYEAAIEEFIKGQGINAEAAVTDAGAMQAAAFSAMDNNYFRARAADITDISVRIVGNLSGVIQDGIESDVPVILASDDLAPSETVQLDKSKILGFVTSGGSDSSHTAILARTMGIPAIIGVGDQLKSEYEGRDVIVDGDTGSVIVDADAATCERMARKGARLLKHRKGLERLKGKPSVSKDGQKIRICCNIGSPADVRTVRENDGDGIGLFRSEFLYLSGDDYPTEEYQFEVYKNVLSDMDGKDVIVRTLDIGSDKQAAYFKLPREENPALGNRALRICLNRPEIFRTQLRALYRASVYGSLSIMFPMVTSVWEVKEAKTICEQVKAGLAAEGIPVSDQVGIGIMIETPAAAMISDRLAKEVDFFSIGTNDLTQYTLACDRQNSELGRFFDPRHPAVLRLIKLVVENAHKENIWCGICGEIGADPALTETFLAIGVDELSVFPRAVLPLREKVRETKVAAVREALVGELTNSENMS